MDDLIIVVENKEKAVQSKEKLEPMFAKINLEYNRKKTKIYPISKGISFLGYKFVVTDTGKVVQIPLPSKIKNAKRKYKHMATKTFSTRKITLYKIEESYRDFRASISEGNSYYSLQRMDNYYLNLWKGTEYEQREIQFIANLRTKTERNKRRKNKSR